MMEDRHVTIKEIAHDVEIITGSENSLLTEDLSIRRLSEIVGEIHLQGVGGAQ